MAFKVDINGNVQYANREAGIKAHAEDYSFNIDSELFQQLTPEQQKLWRKEIEQAVVSGGHCGLNLAKDKRYDEEPVSEEWVEELRAKLDSLSKEDFKKVFDKYAVDFNEEPISEDLEEAAEEWDESLYRSDAFKAGAKWMNNTVCSEIEKRLEYMQYAPHRADTYKELKSLLTYIKSYV